MNRTTLLAITIMLLLTPFGLAQPHGTGWMFTGIQVDPALARVSLAGQVTTLVTQASLPASTQMEGGVMNTANGHYVIAVTSKVVHQSLLIVDLQGNILRTFQVSPQPPGQGGYVVDVVVDQNGDYIVLEAPGGASTMALYRFDRTFTLATLFAGSPLRLPRAVTVDVDTGDFIVCDASTLYRIPASGSSITTLGRFRVAALGQVTQDAASGDFFVGSNSTQEPGAVIARMTPGGISTTFLASGYTSCTAIASDRASAASPRLAFGVPGPGVGFFFVDMANQVVTRLAAGFTVYPTHLWPDRGQNLSTSQLAPDQWTFHVDFPGEAGRGYVVGLSFTGVRPVLPLPDGRRIPLRVDNLTVLSVSGQLGPLFTGHAGVLNTAGSAQAQLRSAPSLRGLRLWAVAVTLDAAAPLGIATICDPVGLTL